jgi:hypothetical protein
MPTFTKREPQSPTNVVGTSSSRNATSPPTQRIDYRRPAGLGERFKAIANQPRRFLDAYSNVAAVGALVLTVTCAVVIYRAVFAPPPMPVEENFAWYLDLNNGQLFVDEFSKAAPLAAPSGNTADGKPAGVRANVYACGRCDVEANRFVAYIEKTPDDGNPAPDAALITTVHGVKWMPKHSDEAQSLLETLRTKCGGEMTPEFCLPSSK